VILARIPEVRLLASQLKQGRGRVFDDSHPRQALLGGLRAKDIAAPSIVPPLNRRYGEGQPVLLPGEGCRVQGAGCRVQVTGFGLSDGAEAFR
jgi:hypothetical protein